MAKKRQPRKYSKPKPPPLVEVEAPALVDPPNPLRIPWIEPLAARFRAASPDAVLRLTPYSLVTASLLVAVVVWTQTLLQPAHANSLILLRYCGVGLALALALGLIFRKLDRPLPKNWEPGTFKAYALAIQLGMLLLFIPAFLGVWRSSNTDLVWITWGFLDKRWLVSLYWLGVATFLLFPHLIFALLTGISRTAEPAGSTAAGVAPGARLRAPRLWLRVGAKTVLAIAMAWFYAGPPWHLSLHHRFIDYHEQQHLGPLQAIYKGFLPGIGPATTQYGPGSQLFYYAFMKLSGQFTLVGFRHANAAIHFLSVLIFSVFVFQLLKVWEAPVVVWLAMAYSSLRLLSFAGGGGALAGFYGWTNELRYLGILLVAGTLPLLLRGWKDRFPNYPALFLGLLWGLFTWMAQENLAGGIVASGLLLLLLWLTGTARPRAIWLVAGSLAAGCALFWLPVLMYYASHGALLQYLRYYALCPSLVAKGFSNTYWSAGQNDPQYPMFLFTGPVLVILGVFTLCDVPRLRLRAQLTVRQATFLAVTVALAVSYQSSLFRSDPSHLTNTMTALPLVLYLGCSDVALWLTRAPQWRWTIRVVFAVLFVLIYPLSQTLAHPYSMLVQPQVARFRPVIYPETPPKDSRTPFLRATRYLSDEPMIYMNPNLKLRAFLEDASEIEKLIGTRKTLVVSHPAGTPGLLSFMADLTPAPHLMDSVMMVYDLELQREVEADFKKRAAECEAVIAVGSGQPEVQIFLEAHPGAQTVSRSLAGMPYFVFLARPATQLQKGMN